MVAPVKTHIVVVVDDDRRIRESIQSMVESAGHAMFVFATAELFLQSGMVAEAGCLITDVRMPGIDGIELQRRVQSGASTVAGHLHLRSRR